MDIYLTATPFGGRLPNSQYFLFLLKLVMFLGIYRNPISLLAQEYTEWLVCLVHSSRGNDLFREGLTSYAMALLRECPSHSYLTFAPLASTVLSQLGYLLFGDVFPKSRVDI